jgi:glyoxylase-like metal-dependent hydrolase (beta-lactamase superfamily II)
MDITTPTSNITEVRIPVPLPVNYTNCYVIDTDDGLVIVDAGMDTPDARQAWENWLGTTDFMPGSVRFIFVTHGHPDHLGLAEWLSHRLAAPIAMMSGEAQSVRTFRQREQEPKGRAAIRQFYRPHDVPDDMIDHWLALDAMFAEAVQLPSRFDEVQDGDVRKIGGVTFKFIEQGGHTAHQGVIYLPEQTVLFTGDQVLERITPNVSLWPGSRTNPLEDYLNSLHRLALLPHPVGLPAHEKRIFDVNHRIGELLAHHDARNAKLLGFLNEGAQSAYQLTRQLFSRPLDDYQVRFALGETLAHLEYLRNQERVVQDNSDGKILYAPS